jgi:hypothetical protein
MNGPEARVEEDRLKALVDFSDDALCFFDFLTLSLLVSNTAASKILSYNAASIPGSVTLHQLVATVLSHQCPTVVEDMLSQLRKEKSFTWESRKMPLMSVFPSLSVRCCTAGSSQGILVKVKAAPSKKLGVL